LIGRGGYLQFFMPADVALAVDAFALDAFISPLAVDAFASILPQFETAFAQLEVWLPVLEFLAFIEIFSLNFKRLIVSLFIYKYAQFKDF